jgi:hypothetical protein
LLEKHETHCKMAFAPGVELEQDAADWSICTFRSTAIEVNMPIDPQEKPAHSCFPTSISIRICDDDEHGMALGRDVEFQSSSKQTSWREFNMNIAWQINYQSEQELIQWPWENGKNSKMLTQIRRHPEQCQKLLATAKNVWKNENNCQHKSGMSSATTDMFPKVDGSLLTSCRSWHENE